MLHDFIYNELIIKHMIYIDSFLGWVQVCI